MLLRLQDTGRRGVVASSYPIYLGGWPKWRQQFGVLPVRPLTAPLPARCTGAGPRERHLSYRPRHRRAAVRDSRAAAFDRDHALTRVIPGARAGATSAACDRRGPSLSRRDHAAGRQGRQGAHSATSETPGYPRSGWAAKRSERSEERSERSREGHLAVPPTAVDRYLGVSARSVRTSRQP